MQKAFAYLRVSSKAQVHGDGFPRQRAAIKAHAKAHGIEIVRWFEERGVSGKTEWEDRPTWVEMIAALNGVRTIVIERLDRLARRIGVQEHILDDLKDRGISLVSTAEPDVDSTNPDRVLFRDIMGAIAKFDRAMIEAKLRHARERKRSANGRCEGRKPFGAREGETAIIERMRALKAEGLGFDKLAERLNQEGVPTRTRGLWHGRAVNRILSREA